MRIPIATYRLQFRPAFGFHEASAIIAYLAELGITDIYASPVFQARKGSTHGYDLVDPCRLNGELGSDAQFAELNKLVQRHAMGWLQDIVPNHMVFDADNPYIADILENGPGSPYQDYFDVNWEHYHEEIHGKILAPFLGQFYGHALEAGELRLGYGEEGFAVNYHRLRFPLKIESYLAILEPAALELRRSLGEKHSDYIQFLGILYVLKTLRKNTDNGERRSQVKFVKQNLWALYPQNPSIHQAI